MHFSLKRLGWFTIAMLSAFVATPSIGRTPAPSRSSEAKLADTGNSEQRAAAAKLATAFATTWNLRDGAAYGDAYWPDAELVDPSGQVWNGRVAIIQTHVDLWAGPAKGTHMTARVRRVRALGPSLFVVDIDTAATGFSPPPPGAPDGVVHTRLKHVVEKRHGKWKIIASQNTFVS